MKSPGVVRQSFFLREDSRVWPAAITRSLAPCPRNTGWWSTTGALAASPAVPGGADLGYGLRRRIRTIGRAWDRARVSRRRLVRAAISLGCAFRRPERVRAIFPSNIAGGAICDGYLTGKLFRSMDMAEKEGISAVVDAFDPTTAFLPSARRLPRRTPSTGRPWKP